MTKYSGPNPNSSVRYPNALLSDIIASLERIKAKYGDLHAFGAINIRGLPYGNLKEQWPAWHEKPRNERQE